MGFLSVKVGIENVSRPGGRVETQLLVDTGALYSMVPAAVLRQAGVQARWQVEFQVADGRRTTRDMGEARFHFDGHDAVSRVIFGEDVDAAILGVVTLEELGLEVDPVNQQLRPARMIMY